MKHLFFQSLSEVSARIKTKELSSVEVTDLLLERIQLVDPSLNAYIQVLSESAKEQARILEEEMMKGSIRGPLHGVPIAIKDIFETKGQVTTSGSKLFRNWKPDKDAVVVQRLKKAGAVIIGKANLHEFAMGATTENPHFGPTRNPWNPSKIPGGSSGGSAAAVAAGLCYGALGTDTGGSIRMPAALCGIVGLKPTYDAVSREGCTPLSWSLDHIGPMTRTVEDSAILFTAISNDHVDMELARTDLSGITIGVLTDYFMEGTDPEIANILFKAIDKLKMLGTEIIEVQLPNAKEALEAQRVIFQSEAYAFHEPMFTKYPNEYGEDVRERLNAGTSKLASEYIQAQRQRNHFRQKALEVMESCDILLNLTNIIEPFDIGSMSPADTANAILKLGKTPIGNFLGFPAVSVPCGFTVNKLPVGMQLLGKPYAEKLIMNVAHVYEQSEQWVAELEKNTAYEPFESKVKG